MGIPQLRRRLEPYAERAVIGPGNVVLDGPALAYHVLSLCSRESHKASPFGQPSYELLGKTAVAWLDRIQTCGLSVAAIYFDSYLPNSKRAERIQRLIRSTRDLIKYRSAFPAGVPGNNPRHLDDADVDLFPIAWPGERKAKPPPPPFLVPAVIDALRESSRFCSLINLVPGEADGFCAQHVQRDGGTVLTSDSDLLVHDLGDAGGVVFFADIDADTETQRLIAPQYRPADLCRRLSIMPETGLRYLAFEVSRDPYLTLEQAVEKSKRSEAVSVSRGDYCDFIEQYLSPEVAPKLQGGQTLDLDPRVSEIVLRSVGISGAATPISESSSELEMYLPFLLDCPSRTSAWEASKGLRQMAYSILQSAGKITVPSVSEMRRLQSMSSGSRVGVPAASEIDQLGASLLALLSKIKAGVSAPELVWVVLSIYQDIVMTTNRARGYPLSLEVLGQEAKGRLDICSWEFLHLLAQTQATNYSLRMLRQILEFSRHRTGRLSTIMSELEQYLLRLPSLPGFPSPMGFAGALQQVREAAGLSCLQNLCADYEDMLQHIEAFQRPQTSTKAKNGKSVVSSEGGIKPRFSNPFDLLAHSGE